MSKQKETDFGGCGLLLVVAAISFIVGRGSVDTDPTPMSASASYGDTQIEATTGVQSLGNFDEVDAIDTPPMTVEPEPEPIIEPEPEPRFVYYRNCSAARAAGAAPVYRGDPGYASHLDRDNDGIGCE